MGECGLSYAIVSIMGPQSSGMHSYLLKHISLYLPRVTLVEGLEMMKCVSYCTLECYMFEA